MEIKLNKDFIGLDGKVMNSEKECCILKPDGTIAESNGSVVTTTVPTPDKKLELKKVCINALLANIPDDQTDKYEKYKLFQKFHKANSKIELESGEITMLKELIKKFHETLIMGQAYDMLEGK